jgi:16S rRNA (adenine1518-N6/adenine1519-N6)-dimethyltransferase
VVQRILARPKTKEYGKLSVLLQAYFDIKQIMRLSPASFYPPPKVSSAVIRMIPKHTTNIPKTNYDDFVKIVKLSFTHRRKTLRNNLLETLDKEILKDDFFNKRPEELSWQEYDDMIQHFLYKNN